MVSFYTDLLFHIILLCFLLENELCRGMKYFWKLKFQKVVQRFHGLHFMYFIHFYSATLIIGMKTLHVIITRQVHVEKFILPSSHIIANFVMTFHLHIIFSYVLTC